MWRGKGPRRDALERDDDRLIAVYQAAAQRYASNTTLQWQVPLYAIPTQAALCVGIANTSGAIAAILGTGALIIGTAGAFVMRRIELTARWDRQTLDEFERILLPRQPSLHLMHDAPFKVRLRRKKLLSAEQFLLKRVEVFLMRVVPPSLTLMLLLILVGFGAMALGISRVHVPPETVPPKPHPQMVGRVSKITL